MFASNRNLAGQNHLLSSSTTILMQVFTMQERQQSQKIGAFVV